MQLLHMQIIIMSQSLNCKHGDLENSQCLCDWGWFGAECTESGRTLWGDNAWSTFQVIYIVLYFFILGTALLKLYMTLRLDKVTGFRRLIYRLFRSPKNLSLLYLILIGFFRGFWLWIDPLCFKEKFTRLQDRLLYNTAYPILYGLYASVLLVWGGLYQGMRSTSSDPFRALRKLIMAMMILAFPVSLTISTLQGYRIPSSVWAPLGIALVVAGVLLMVLGFIIFGVLLCIYVEKNTVNNTENCPVGKFNTERSAADIASARHASTLRRAKTKMESPREAVGRETINNQEVDVLEHSWYTFVSNEDRSHIIWEEKFEFHENAIGPKVKIAGNNKNIISLITKDDRAILRSLGLLLTLSIILGFAILVFFSVLSSRLNSTSPENELVILYSAFSIEVFACLLIYIVFTREIKVKEKTELRFFTSISLEMNSKIPKIKFPGWCSKVGLRLHNFYS